VISKLPLFLSTIFIVVFFSCKTQAPAIKSDHNIDANKAGYIQYISGFCFQPCVAHKIIVDENGLMNYEHNPIDGPLKKYFAELDKIQKEKLWELIDQVNWNTVKEEYGTSAEDITPRTLRIFTKKYKKTVLYKHGEPQFITDIGYYIDDIIKQTKWIEFGK